ncbi:uncharacterized protein LOC132907716 isoform X1 [Bombus pascuorum]|uniref:uncharacterized protein LOC132907716 isoform X1 n=1 Tax=Bombus pascuorum TaxID=65598 RepID=UPI00298EC04A|nr:uncharacterized protein LOC132907716 isoform X1 [Bombus pascuorum]
MGVMPSLFLSCFLLGILATTGNGQLASGQGILSTVGVGNVGSGSLSGVPNLNDALASILGPLLGGNSTNGGGNSLIGGLSNILDSLGKVSLNALLQGILNGDLSTLQELIGPIVLLLQGLPIVGPLIMLLSQVLNIPLTLVASIVALLLELLIVLLNVTRPLSG